MEPSDISDRLALEVTMILSIVFLLGGVNTSLPHVSYAKASDWFMIVCFAFVFIALLETMLVYRLTSWNTSSQSENQRNCFVSFLYKLKLRVSITCILYYGINKHFPNTNNGLKSRLDMKDNEIIHLDLRPFRGHWSEFLKCLFWNV